MKKFLVAANWKLNGSIKMISNFFENFTLNLPVYLEKTIVIIAPPTIYLERVNKKIKNTNILLGAQNVDINLKGAFTGETSILMLKEIGVKYVIIGHSERRLLHGENNHIILKKFRLIKDYNLIPILCIGETEKEKKHGLTEKIIKKQLDCIFNNLGERAFRNTVIAYEPIWAIGTGLSASPQDVQLIHNFIKKYIEKYDMIGGKNIIIQYGGSVNEDNAKEFIIQPDINGLLIGNASLKNTEFFNIIKIAHNNIY